MGRTLGAVVAATLLAASCGRSKGPEVTTEPEVTTPVFCADAAGVMQGQETVSILQFSPQYFTDIDADFARLLETAPASLTGEIEALRDGFTLTDEIYTEFGFEAENAAFLEALTDRLDSKSMIQANETIGSHLDRECSADVLAAARSPGGFSFDRSDPIGGVANIAALGTDDATAQCIYDAWGDISDIPPEELTAELMNFPICGTSIFQLITGDQRFTGRDE